MDKINIRQKRSRRKFLSETIITPKPEFLLPSDAAFPPDRQIKKGFSKGYTIIELLCIILIIVVILSSGIPAILNILERGKVNRAAIDIRIMAKQIDEYWNDTGRYPSSLDAVGFGNLTDPWGYLYQYLRIDGGDPLKVGQIRKIYGDHNLNTDYDLYSMGKDGKSSPPLTASVSQDDVLRIDGGDFVGLGSVYREQAQKGKK